MFRGWYNPRTNKFAYGLNLKRAWYNMMGEEIGRGFTISNLQVENQANLTLEETSKGLCLKNDVAFALIIAIFLHMVTMLNEINYLLGLDTILNGEPIGLGNRASQQHRINIGESSSRGDNKS
jgi:hypothetical protein